MEDSDTAQPPPLHNPQKSSMAIASLICGLLFFVPFAFILAIAFGCIALGNIKESQGRLNGRGMAIAGIVLGAGWILLIPVFGLLAAMAIPAFNKVRETSMEKMMMNQARIITSAANQYSLENNVNTMNIQDVVAAGYFVLPTDVSLGSDAIYENEDGEFSLYYAQDNREYFFDSEGVLISKKKVGTGNN